MDIPRWLTRRLDAAGVARVEQAIRQAEATTSAEIVPLIVRRSSTIGHVPVLLLAILVAAWFALGVPAWQVARGAESWLWYLAEAALLLPLTALGARLPWLQRGLTPRADQAQQVEARAILEFHASRIRATEGATGILLFVSLLERRAVVLADHAIAAKLPPDTWGALCDTLIGDIRARGLADAMTTAIATCGALVTPLFPIQPDDENELPDRLLIKE